MGTQQLREGLALGFAQLRKLLGDMRYRAMMLTYLNATDRPGDWRRGGGVPRIGERECDPGRGALDVSVGGIVHVAQDGVDATARKRADGLVPADLTQLPHGCDRQVVICVVEFRAARSGEPVALGGATPAVVLPRGRCVRFGVARIDECIQVPAHSGCGNAKAFADLTSGDGATKQQLNDRAAGVPVRSRHDNRRARNLRTYFHNTIVTEFGKPV